MQDVRLTDTLKHSVQDRLIVLNLEDHMSKSCKKTRSMPATSSVKAPILLITKMHYQDLINGHTKSNVHHHFNTILLCDLTLPPLEPKLFSTSHHISYAQITVVSSNMQINGNTANSVGKFTHFLEEFKNMFTHLINQKSMVLTMLTTGITKLTQ